MLLRVGRTTLRRAIALTLAVLISATSLPIHPAQAAIVYSFTTAGASGVSGPTQAQMTTAYVGTTLSGAVTESTTPGIQLWTVPASGNYTILGAGAKGGNGNSTTGGSGAIIQGDFDLTQGTVIAILVGQSGTNGPSNVGGGGGGTFVMKTTVIDSSSAYVIAGGGGGGPSGATNVTAIRGATTADPAQHGSSSSTVLLANRGSNGQGGGAGGDYHGGGGAGLFGDGGWETNPSCRVNSAGGSGGIAYVRGGTAISGRTYAGGFGGGGSGEWCYAGGAGGGGGYSGGGGGAGTTGTGGGGSSLNNGANKVNTAASNAGAGYATITFNYGLTPGLVSLSLLSGGKSATYNFATTIVATINQTGRVTFFQSGKVIPNCRNLQGSSMINCLWKPSRNGFSNLTAIFMPSSQGVGSVRSEPFTVGVIRRTNNR